MGGGLGYGLRVRDSSVASDHSPSLIIMLFAVSYPLHPRGSLLSIGRAPAELKEDAVPDAARWTEKGRRAS